MVHWEVKGKSVILNCIHLLNYKLEYECYIFLLSVSNSVFFFLKKMGLEEKNQYLKVDLKTEPGVVVAFVFNHSTRETQAGRAL